MQPTRILIAAALALWLAGVLGAQSNILRVPDRYPTIQQALLAAAPGTLILVKPGTYQENLFWPRTDGIRLLSIEGPDRTILDGGGAEKLLGRGDMLYMPTEASKPKRLQGCFVSDAEVERLVYFWGSQKVEEAPAQPESPRQLEFSEGVPLDDGSPGMEGNGSGRPSGSHPGSDLPKPLPSSEVKVKDKVKDKDEGEVEKVDPHEGDKPSDRGEHQTLWEYHLRTGNGYQHHELHANGHHSHQGEQDRCEACAYLREPRVVG